jgi:predicted dehydrogenase
MSGFSFPQTTPPLPDSPRPIVIIGAGGIVRDAHLPAYRKAGFEVIGIVNRNRHKAEVLAGEFAIDRVFETIDEAIAHGPDNAVYDIALPAAMHARTLASLPEGASVLLQKPMGESLVQARDILDICVGRRLNAAVNFQLRYAPFVIAARDLIEQDVIGEVLDLEVRVAVETPWHLWSFLDHVAFAEFYYHSIHYVDLIRSFLGEPQRVYAHSVPHPDAPRMDGSRSAYILDYGDRIRATITTNHHIRYGLDHQEAWIQWSGSKGAIRASLGVLMNYPAGVEDVFEVGITADDGVTHWQTLNIPGTWFPDAFIGTMASVMRSADDPAEEPGTSVRDAFRTMQVIAAASESSTFGGVVPQHSGEEPR